MSKQANGWTPGPWKYAAPLGEGSHAILSDKVNSGGNFHVAICTPDKPTAEADARLIAAAPQMAEALREAKRVILCRDIHDCYEGHFCEACIAKDRARAALRAAGVES